jgi:uncharacterized protein
MALLRNATTGAILATRVERATNFFDRTVGLLARPTVHPDEGLWFERCRAIHTIGMRICIDVIFVDRQRRIVGIHREVKPFRMALACSAAADVIELGAGAIAGCDILIGDRLELV